MKFEAKRDGSIPQISVDGALLHLVHINRDKAGNYRVKADNDIGQSSLDFSIDVHCKLIGNFLSIYNLCSGKYYKI